MKLGDKILKLKGSAGYAELARAADCSAPTIRDIESGRTLDPSVSIVRKLASHFDVSLDWLADDAKEWPPSAVSEKAQVLEIVENTLNRLASKDSLTAEEQKLVNEYRRIDDDDHRKELGSIVAAIVDLYDKTEWLAYKKGVHSVEAEEAVFSLYGRPTSATPASGPSAPAPKPDVGRIVQEEMDRGRSRRGSGRGRGKDQKVG